MEKCTAKLTVCFEEPFWIGLYERECGGRYEVCKITFGAEPRDCEVYAFFLWHWSQLKFSPSIPSVAACERKINPKRMQRSIVNQMQQEQKKQAKKPVPGKNGNWKQSADLPCGRRSKEPGTEATDGLWVKNNGCRLAASIIFVRRQRNDS